MQTALRTYRVNAGLQPPFQDEAQVALARHILGNLKRSLDEILGPFNKQRALQRQPQVAFNTAKLVYGRVRSICASLHGFVQDRAFDVPALTPEQLLQKAQAEVSGALAAEPFSDLVTADWVERWLRESRDHIRFAPPGAALQTHQMATLRVCVRAMGFQARTGRDLQQSEAELFTRLKRKFPDSVLQEHRSEINRWYAQPGRPWLPTMHKRLRDSGPTRMPSAPGPKPAPLRPAAAPAGPHPPAPAHQPPPQPDGSGLRTAPGSGKPPALGFREIRVIRTLLQIHYEESNGRAATAAELASALCQVGVSPQSVATIRGETLVAWYNETGDTNPG